MITNMFLKTIKIALLVFLLSFTVFNVCLASESPLSPETVGKMEEQDKNFAIKAGFRTNTSIGDVVANVIQAVLGLLGIIFIVLMVYAGYLWMMAGGNEEQVKKAKDLIRAAIIGLIIIVAAYSITYFVFEALSKAGITGGGSVHTSP